MAAKDIDKEEDQVNFRYSLAILKQLGDTEGLAKAKKAHPAEYAEWERRTAGIKNTMHEAKNPRKR